MLTYTDAQCEEMVDQAVLGLFSPASAGLKDAIPSTFLSTIYCSLVRQIDRNIPTACTNGKFLRFSPEWYCRLSRPMRLTVLAHELWHVALLHMGRAMGREFRLWNAACDYAINWMLHEHGFVFDRNPDGSVHGLLDARFADMTAEQIYQILLDEQKQGSEVQLPFGEDMVEIGSDTEAESTIVRNIVRAVTMSRMAGEAGKLPGDLVSMVDAILDPKLPWHVLARRWLDEQGEEGYDWKRPSRRYAADDLYLPSPGQEGRLSRLLWAFDTSGSMTDGQVATCIGEMQHAKDELKPRHMTVVNFDTKIRQVFEFEEDDELRSLQFTGRGGTNLDEVWALATKLRPKALVVLSDLCCSLPPPIPGVDILWICLDNPERKVDHGHIVHVDSTSPTTA